VAAALGAEVRPAAEVLEVAIGVVADQHNVAAVAAVTAIGTALGDVRLPAEAHTAVPTAAGQDLDSGSVFHLCVSVSGLL
jgi:hypothetical protein